MNTLPDAPGEILGKHLTFDIPNKAWKEIIIAMREYAKAYAPVPGKEEIYRKALETILSFSSGTEKDGKVSYSHIGLIAKEALASTKQSNESVQQAAKDLTNPFPLKDVLQKLVDASGYLLNKKDYDGPDHEEIFHCVKRAKEIIQQLLAGASFNSKDEAKESDQDKCWSQAISMIEVADTDGNDYLQKYDELHKKLKSKFTITSNKNEIQQAHDKSQYE